MTVFWRDYTRFDEEPEKMWKEYTELTAAYIKPFLYGQADAYSRAKNKALKQGQNLGKALDAMEPGLRDDSPHYPIDEESIGLAKTKSTPIETNISSFHDSTPVKFEYLMRRHVELTQLYLDNARYRENWGKRSCYTRTVKVFVLTLIFN